MNKKWRMIFKISMNILKKNLKFLMLLIKTLNNGIKIKQLLNNKDWS